MSSKAEKDRGKQIEEKCQTLLTEMLRDEDNKYCVDCDAKGPRWASWNLGIFLCIRCAGIHRNLGVHISKVKSVNLDTWTPEQVVSLQQMGNSRARAVYEANIPDNFRRPQTDTALEAFVRAKYEHKKYIAKEWVPTPVPNVKQNWDKELDEEAERQKKRKKETKAPSTRKVDSATPQMIPKPKASTSPRPPRSSPVVSSEASKTTKSSTLDLFFDTPTTANLSASSNGEDIFSGFLSAPPVAVDNVVKPVEKTEITDPTSGRTAEEESFFNQPAPSNQEKRQLTKDSILALYGSAPAQQQQQQPNANLMFGIPGGVYTQPQGGFPPQPAPGMVYGMPNMGMGAPVKNGVFNPVTQQPGNVPMGMASNPFFNMGANPLANPAQSFPHMAQAHVALENPNQDLMSDFSQTIASKQNYASAKLPQQMGRMNLGGQPVGGLQPGLMGMHQNPPTNMQMGANNATTMNAFAPQNNAGHTLATNLWQ